MYAMCSFTAAFVKYTEDFCVADGEEMDDGGRRAAGSQGFVAIARDSTSPPEEEEEGEEEGEGEGEGEGHDEEMEGEGEEEDKLSQLPDGIRERLVSLHQEKYICAFSMYLCRHGIALCM